MKKVLFFVGMFLAANSFAQSNTIKLNKGQTITVTSTVSQNMDMGMGMTMTSSSNSTHVIKVNNDEGDKYNVSATLTKIKTNTSAMGQESSYDSENPGAADTELAVVMGKSLNVVENAFLDKKTGIAKSATPKNNEEAAEDEDDFIKGMLNGEPGSDNSGIISSTFFTQAAGKKVGDKWVDSNTVNKFSNVNNYTVTSINGDVMTISLDGIVSGSQQVETQGMQIDVTMNTKNKGSIELNKKTLQVLKKTVNADVTSSMDMMGQTMDMTGTITTLTEYK